jgi:uncharacterized protein YkwD
MFDRRVNAFITVNAYLFNASFTDGLSAEIQVNPEFGSSVTAMVEAQKYGQVIGQLPRVLRTEVKTVWIHKGIQPFGGGNNNLLIHTGQAADYVANGILEETLVHEAAHTSLDATHAAAPGWLAAQIADGNFISTYARDNPTREDVAESFLPYLAVRYRSNRVSQTYLDTVSQTIPNRMTYFDKQSFNMYPITGLFSFSIYLPIIIKSEVITTTPTSDFVNRVVAATNQNRIQNGCQPLTVNALLNQAADRHSKDMALNDVFDHTGSDGSTPEQRIAATGYTANATGENIAAGNPTPEEAVMDWMNSLGHRANILDCNFTEIGVGYYFLANDTGNNNYNHYWTQVFARP